MGAWYGPSTPLSSPYPGPDPNAPLAVASTRPQRIDVFDALQVPETMEHWWIDPTNANANWNDQADAMFDGYVLSGALGGGPDCASRRGSDNLDVFAIASQSLGGPVAIWHRNYTDAGGWQAIQQLPNSTGLNSVCAVSWGPGRLDVFSADNGLPVHWWIDPLQGVGTWRRETLEGSASGAMSVVSWGSRRLDLFDVGTDGTLQHWWFDQPDGYNFAKPEAIGNEAGPYTMVTAVSWGPQRLDVFATQKSGGIARLVYDATGPNVVNFDDRTPFVLGQSSGYGPVGATCWGPSRVDVFAAAGGDMLTHWYDDGTVGQPGMVTPDQTLGTSLLSSGLAGYGPGPAGAAVASPAAGQLVVAQTVVGPDIGAFGSTAVVAMWSYY